MISFLKLGLQLLSFLFGVLSFVICEAPSPPCNSASPFHSLRSNPDARWQTLRNLDAFTISTPSTQTGAGLSHHVTGSSYFLLPQYSLPAILLCSTVWESGSNYNHLSLSSSACSTLTAASYTLLPI